MDHGSLPPDRLRQATASLAEALRAKAEGGRHKAAQAVNALPRRTSAIMALLCIAALAWSRAPQGTRAGNSPLSPDEALASFELEAGYRIELAAAEPLIRAPVAIAFDERGRMYVVENRGYPGPLEGSTQTAAPLGVIAL